MRQSVIFVVYKICFDMVQNHRKFLNKTSAAKCVMDDGITSQNTTVKDPEHKAIQ